MLYLETEALPCAVGAVLKIARERDQGKRKRARLRRPSSLAPRSLAVLLRKTARDVAEHVLDLVAKNDQHDDDDDGDQDENKGVLDHALPLLTVEQLTEPKVQIGQHAIHLLTVCRPSFTLSRQTSNGALAKTWPGNFHNLVTAWAGAGACAPPSPIW